MKSPWWHDLVLYAVYVRGFYDSDGDGIGDLRGLAEKLPYIRDLGVGALSLLPIFPGPLRDDGYDVADYRGIHPDLGTIDDVRLVLSTAHALGPEPARLRGPLFTGTKSRWATTTGWATAWACGLRCTRVGAGGRVEGTHTRRRHRRRAFPVHRSGDVPSDARTALAAVATP